MDASYGLGGEGGVFAKDCEYNMTHAFCGEEAPGPLFLALLRGSLYIDALYCTNSREWFSPHMVRATDGVFSFISARVYSARDPDLKGVSGFM